MICAGVIFLSFYNQKVEVTVLKDTKVSYLEDVSTLDFISANGEIISEDEKVDTSSLGKKKIEYKLKNKYGKVSSYTLEIEVVDTEAPKLEVKDSSITVGESIDLLSFAIASDNYDKELEIKVSGDYDTSKAGKYEITYTVEDSSGNKTEEKAVLTVKEKAVVSSSSKTGNDTVKDTTFTTSKGFTGVTKNGVTYIDGVLIVNKTYSLPSSYGNGLTSETLAAFNKMKAAAKEAGLNIYISSGFRSYTKQNTVYNNYVARDGKVAADTYSARPGYSEHQSGLSFDVNTISTAFDNTKEAKWLANNCYKYGFILRFPEGKDDETGYMYESWHFRYIGDTTLAEKLYNNGDWISLEAYFGITSKY
jgi:D-alanyl-D-alanine carboxypeptidase